MLRIALRVMVVLCVVVMLFPVAGSLARDLGSDATWPAVPASVMIAATIIAGFYALANLVGNRN